VWPQLPFTIISEEVPIISIILAGFELARSLFVTIIGVLANLLSIV
jgi:hypothetical protein